MSFDKYLKDLKEKKKIKAVVKVWSGRWTTVCPFYSKCLLSLL
jgi:hypothetical protein